MSRRRATAIVIRDNRILLVRDRNQKNFSLPGGKANQNEPALAAAIRELYEELKVEAYWAKRLPDCDHMAKFNHHKVCLLKSDSDITLDHRELEAFIWWDMKQEIARFPHVDIILGKYFEAQE